MNSMTDFTCRVECVLRKICQDIAGGGSGAKAVWLAIQ